MKVKLPYDYSRCMNEECPQKDKCARFTNFRDGHMRPYYGSPVTTFGSWDNEGNFSCGDIIPDEIS